MSDEQTCNTSEQQLVVELHVALNKITALLVSFNGFEYHCVQEALQVLEKSSRTHKLPVREILAQKIEKEAQP